MRSSKDVSGRSARPVSLANLLEAVSRELGLERKVQEYALLSLWREVVPVSFRDSTQAVGLKTQGRESVLQVTASDGPTASALSFHLDVLRERLNAFYPQTGVTVTRITLGVGRVRSGQPGRTPNE